MTVQVGDRVQWAGRRSQRQGVVVNIDCGHYRVRGQWRRGLNAMIRCDTGGWTKMAVGKLETPA